MKLIDIKLAAFIISAFTMMMLSGCGSSGTSSDTQLVQGAIQDQAPYVIDAHHDSTAVVHSHVDPSVDGTHQWTHISGPAVTITNPTSPTATILVPPTATAPIVLQHTHTNTKTGQKTKTQHKVVPVAATSALSVVVSKPESVQEGTKASLHASASGGTAPYIYVWQQTQGTTVTLDVTYPSAPTFIIPLSTTPGSHQNETLTFKVHVLDSTGAEVSAEESIISVSTVILLDAPVPLREVDNSRYGAGHPTSRGPITITNVIAGETYLWEVSEIHGVTPPIVDLSIYPASLSDTTKAYIDFKTPDVSVTTTYDLQITVKNNAKTRYGFIDTQITVKP